MDPREVQFAELRRRELARKIAQQRLSSQVAAPRPRLRLIRPLVAWVARACIRLGVRLFLMSKRWEQRGNPVYNDVSEWEPLAVEAAVE